MYKRQPKNPPHNIKDGDSVLISDCYDGDIFEVTGTPGSNIPHGVTFSKAYKKAESGLYPVHENEYCIAPGIDGVTPALRRLRYPRKTGGALECAVHGDSLIEGAENLQILYGVDTDGTADGIANKYIPWSDNPTVLDPDRIGSLRISLLLRLQSEKLFVRHSMLCGGPQHTTLSLESCPPKF